MANVTKYTKAGCGHMFAHYERAKGENGKYIQFGNTNIDTEKTHQNYNLAPSREISQGDFVRQRCGEVYCFNRKDVKVMCSWIVTAPDGIAGTEHEREFFEKTYSFLDDMYGQENVVSAYVHKDEVTPHIHFAFVPVVPDEKRGQKVSAKECITRAKLKMFHDDLDKYLEREMPGRYQGGILNEATKEGNKSIEELKRESATERVAKAEQEASKIVGQAKSKAQALADTAKGFNDEIRAYKGAIGFAHELDSIGKPTITGRVSMTADEAKTIKEQAAAYWAADVRANEAEKKLVNHLRDTKKLRQEVPELRREVRELKKSTAAAVEERNRIVAVLKSNPELAAAYNKQVDVLEQQKAERKAAHRRQRRDEISR